MKKLLCTSVAGLLIGNALPAFAASTTDLTVKGLIVPSACAPSLSANGTVDVGRISIKDLNPDAYTRLTPATLQLSINCEAPTLFAMKATDNRADSTVGVTDYGIGKTSAGERIGGYFMGLDKGTADESPVQMIWSMDNGASWVRMWEDDSWQKNMLISIQDPATPRVPMPAKDTLMELSVNTFILPARGLTITEDTLIDGSATIEIKYL